MQDETTDIKKVIPEAQDEAEVEAWMGFEEASRTKEVPEENSLGNLRPGAFAEYIGQSDVKENLLISCGAARQRGEAMDHVLFYGPPGLGKTTLARILSTELGVGFKSTSGPVIERPGDLAAILTSLEAHDVLFIDEIHRMPRITEEVLYPAMEDFSLDILIGQGPSARSVKINLKPFTLVGATTRTGLLTSPLRDRFGIVERLNYYNAEELSAVVTRSAAILGVEITQASAVEIGRRSRGTPRIANRILKRVRDYAQSREEGRIGIDEVAATMKLLGIDSIGLGRMDHLYLTVIAEKFAGGPVGLGTIAAALSEERDTIEDMVEPYLVRQGLVNRTSRGRELTELAARHLDLPAVSNESASNNLKLFD